MTGPGFSADAEELIRDVSKAMLADPSLLTPIRDAVLGATARPFASDPAIIEAVGEAARDNTLHWARSMLAKPSEPVQPHLTGQVIGVAREGFRWGEENTFRAAYRAGEEAMRSTWMTLAFTICRDPEILLPALDRASRSLAQWIESTTSALLDLLEKERGALSGDEQVRRLELVNRLLGGEAPTDKLKRSLGYPLKASHLGVIVSAPPRVADRADLVQAADAVARLTESASQLLVHASASSLWLWVTPRVRITADDLAGTALPEVRLAFGPVDEGVDGFRRTHHGALQVQRLVNDHGERRIAFHDDVAAVLLVAGDGARLREFVHATLGPLASGSAGHAELRETLRVYLRERYNATRTANRLYTHRNTVLQRIRRAEKLLPAPLDRRGTQVGLALEVLHWLDVRLD